MPSFKVSRNLLGRNNKGCAKAAKHAPTDQDKDAPPESEEPEEKWDQEVLEKLVSASAAAEEVANLNHKEYGSAARSAPESKSGLAIEGY